MVKDCPKCGLVNPPDAQRCDCGYDFISRTVKESYLVEKDHQAQTDLTTGEVLVCVLLPIIGIVLGLMAVRRRPGAGTKMLLISGIMMAVGIVARVLIAAR
jgi:hypothetical protein